jgi:anti-sigma regulatory factor (Ser/Thr protein kinase)
MLVDDSASRDRVSERVADDDRVLDGRSGGERAMHVVWRPVDGGDVAVVGRARRWLSEALPRLIGRRPRGHLQDDTELLLVELVTNAVLHAGRVTAVQLRLMGETLRVTVCDPASAVPVARQAAPDADRGRGIALVEVLATRWGVDCPRPAVGKCVWLELSTTSAAA